MYIDINLPWGIILDLTLAVVLYYSIYLNFFLSSRLKSLNGRERGIQLCAYALVFFSVWMECVEHSTLKCKRAFSI